MSRVNLASPDELPPFLHNLYQSVPEEDWPTRNCARAFAANPSLFEEYLKFYYPWHASNGVGLLEARIKELIRLRIATLNGCKTCKAARLNPAQVSEQEAVSGVDSPGDDFSPRELAALQLAETMAVDHFSIDDARIAELRKHFSEGELLELMMMTGQYIGFGRMLAVLQLENVTCPIDTK